MGAVFVVRNYVCISQICDHNIESDLAQIELAVDKNTSYEHYKSFRADCVISDGNNISGIWIWHSEEHYNCSNQYKIRFEALLASNCFAN